VSNKHDRAAAEVDKHVGCMLAECSRRSNWQIDQWRKKLVCAQGHFEHEQLLWQSDCI